MLLLPKKRHTREKMSFASGGTHLLNQIQQVAFAVYIITSACFGLV